jgi:hypothetical protein
MLSLLFAIFAIVVAFASALAVPLMVYGAIVRGLEGHWFGVFYYLILAPCGGVVALLMWDLAVRAWDEYNGK